MRAGLIRKGEPLSPDVDRAFDLRIASLNLFTSTYRGRDVMPRIAESIRREAARETGGGDKDPKALFNASIGYALYTVFGCVPACVGHTKEYVRFWQGLGRTADAIPPLSIWQTGPRYQQHAKMWRQVDTFLSGAIPIQTYTDMFPSDHATDIIESMVGGLRNPFYVNTFNGGAVTNLAPDAFLELLCDFGPSGPRPCPVGAMPRGIRGLQE